MPLPGRWLGLARPANWHPPARLGGGPVRTMRLLLARHRRPFAVGLALTALWITLRSAAPAPPATVPVLVATHDLAAGQTLTSDDLRAARWPTDQVPSGRLSVAAGRTLAGPIHSGELMTDARVIGPGLLVGQPIGTVAMPVRLGDPATGALVRPGDRVDILASATGSSSAATWSSDLTERSDPTRPAGDTGTVTTSSNPYGTDRVISGALVLAVPGAADTNGWSGDEGSTGTGLSGLTGGPRSGSSADPSSAAGLLVLAVTSSEARRIAAAQSGRHLGIAVLPQR